MSDVNNFEDFNVSRSSNFIRPLGGRKKRIFDVFISVVALISLFGLFLVIALLILVYSKGPVFFVHNRIGFDGKSFPCFKFRTMVLDADKRLDHFLEMDETARLEFGRYRKLKNDPRVIPVIGKFLRKSSLDELPQLLNVILGQMSLVGPRPVTLEETVSYGRSLRYYLNTRPGMTGLWQISGRNNLSFEDRVEIDRAYVKSWSFFRDIRIMLRTVSVILFRRGAY